MTSTMELPAKNIEADYLTHPADLVKGGVSSHHSKPRVVLIRFRKLIQGTRFKTFVTRYLCIASSHHTSGLSFTFHAISWSRAR